MFCGACVPRVWCVTSWALGLPAGCPRVPSAGSLDPNCGFGVTLPWPPSFGSAATLVPPPPPRVGHCVGVSSVALPPLPLATGAWFLTLPRAPLFLRGDPRSRLGAHFGLVLLEMQKEKPQPRALRGAEAGGLIGSILGEFLWRAGHPLPEPQGARPAFLLRSHACLLPLRPGLNPSCMRTLWAGGMCVP